MKCLVWSSFLIGYRNYQLKFRNKFDNYIKKFHPGLSLTISSIPTRQCIEQSYLESFLLKKKERKNLNYLLEKFTGELNSGDNRRMLTDLDQHKFLLRCSALQY